MSLGIICGPGSLRKALMEKLGRWTAALTQKEGWSLAEPVSAPGI